MESGRTVREFTVTTTQRNQVTIPAEVRRILGLKPMDKVVFTIEDGDEVRLSAASLNLESAYGSVKPSATPEDFDEICRNARTPRLRPSWDHTNSPKAPSLGSPEICVRRKPFAE